MKDLSIICTGIRPQLWTQLYQSIVEGVDNYSFEIIFIGPYLPPQDVFNKENVHFIKSYSSPSRCAMIASTLANGNLLMFCSDDSIIRPKAIKSAIEQWKNSENEKNVICLRYTEGKGRTGQEFPKEYYRARFHADQRLPGVLEEWYLAPTPLLKKDYYIFMGGLDCSYENWNLNVHDLVYRIQKDGGKVLVSDEIIMDLDHEQDDHHVLAEAYHQNDLPRFQNMYSAYDADRIRIDFNNWRTAEEVWSRRFK